MREAGNQESRCRGTGQGVVFIFLTGKLGAPGGWVDRGDAAEHSFNVLVPRWMVSRREVDYCSQGSAKSLPNLGGELGASVGHDI